MSISADQVGPNYTALITGFEPFTTGQGLKLTENPTSLWAHAVANQVPNCFAATLPVSFQRTKLTLRKLFDKHQPKVWIGLGFAPHRLNIDVECIALNLEDCRGADNDGESPKRREIIPKAPLALTTRFNVDELVAKLNVANLNAQASFHAGTFLCNQTFYLGCHAVEMGPSLDKAGFIHVPPSINAKAFMNVLIEVLTDEVSRIS